MAEGRDIFDISEKPPPYEEQPEATYPLDNTTQPGYPALPGYPAELGFSLQPNCGAQHVHSAQPDYTQQPHTAPPPYQGPSPVFMQPGYPQMFQPGQQGQQNATAYNMDYPITNVMSMPMAPRPKNWMGLSVFTCLFCTLPIGLAALIFSCQVDSAYSTGDYQRAVRNSKIARRLNIISIVVGICWIIIFIIYVSLWIHYSQHTYL